MRLITHTDLDGVVCAVLITSVEDVVDIVFTDPLHVKELSITKDDIIADLPYRNGVGLWFDHHISNRIEKPFEGLWKQAPSCARVVFDYYENPYLEKYRPLVDETDRIDGGLISFDEVAHPRGLYLLSLTLDTEEKKSEDDAYRLHVIRLLKTAPPVETVLADPKVSARVERKRADIQRFVDAVPSLAKVTDDGRLVVIDLRGHELPRTNNYLLYTLFPRVEFSLKIFTTEDGVRLSLGRNNFLPPRHHLNIGTLLREVAGGGGHENVGGATVPAAKSDDIIARIIERVQAAPLIQPSFDHP